MDGQHYNRASSYSFWHGRDIGKHPYVTSLALAWSPSTYIWTIVECHNNCFLERWCRLDPDMAQGKGGVMSLGQTCRQLLWQLMSGMKLHSTGWSGCRCVHVVLEQLCTSINSQKAQRTELLLLATFHVVGPSEERETVRGTAHFVPKLSNSHLVHGFPKGPCYH